MRYYSEALFFDPDIGVEVNCYTNVNPVYQVQQRWNFRSPLRITELETDFAIASGAQNAIVRLYINGVLAYSTTVDQNITSVNVVGEKLILQQGDLYQFSVETNYSSSFIRSIWFIGEYNPIDGKILYESPTTFFSAITTSQSASSLYNGNVGNQFYYEDVNQAFITGVVIAHDSAVVATGTLRLFENGVEIDSQSYTVSPRLEEVYIPIVRPFWSKIGVRLSCTITDSNNSGDIASIKFVGYRRELKGNRQFRAILYGGETPPNTTADTAVPDWNEDTPANWRTLSKPRLKAKNIIGAEGANSVRLGGTVGDDLGNFFDLNNGFLDSIISSSLSHQFRESQIEELVNNDGDLCSYLEVNKIYRLFVRTTQANLQVGARVLFEQPLKHRLYWR